MFYNIDMDPLERLKLLSQHMEIEADNPTDCRAAIFGKNQADIPITEAVMPNGQKIKLLKTMQTSACERNCYYCPFRAGRDLRRATFKPDDLAATFLRLYQAKVVEGIFLSSGIIGGGVKTQDKMLDTADILRNKLHYKGYIHLKIMPGIEKDQLEQAMQLASRISVNLEAPNSTHLHKLAPKKVFLEELLQPLIWAEQIRSQKSPHRSWNRRWPSSATQFVVGAVGESDLELVAVSEKLFSQHKLKRIFYSTFNPLRNTPLEHHPAENPLRSHRLYQSSYLIRDYGFSLEDMPFSPQGFLPLEKDPKLAWAEQHLSWQPVEVNLADQHELIRIPGIGLKSAQTIIQARRSGKIKDISQLKRIGINSKKAAAFILLDGRQPAWQAQLF